MQRSTPDHNNVPEIFAELLTIANDHSSRVEKHITLLGTLDQNDQLLSGITDHLLEKQEITKLETQLSSITGIISNLPAPPADSIREGCVTLIRKVQQEVTRRKTPSPTTSPKSLRVEIPNSDNGGAAYAPPSFTNEYKSPKNSNIKAKSPIATHAASPQSPAATKIFIEDTTLLPKCNFNRYFDNFLVLNKALTKIIELETTLNSDPTKRQLVEALEELYEATSDIPFNVLDSINNPDIADRKKLLDHLTKKAMPALLKDLKENPDAKEEKTNTDFEKQKAVSSELLNVAKHAIYLIVEAQLSLPIATKFGPLNGGNILARGFQQHLQPSQQQAQADGLLQIQHLTFSQQLKKIHEEEKKHIGNAETQLKEFHLELAKFFPNELSNNKSWVMNVALKFSTVQLIDGLHKFPVSGLFEIDDWKNIPAEFQKKLKVIMDLHAERNMIASDLQNEMAKLNQQQQKSLTTIKPISTKIKSLQNQLEAKEKQIYHALGSLRIPFNDELDNLLKTDPDARTLLEKCLSLTITDKDFKLILSQTRETIRTLEKHYKANNLLEENSAIDYAESFTDKAWIKLKALFNIKPATHIKFDLLDEYHDQVSATFFIQALEGRKNRLSKLNNWFAITVEFCNFFNWYYETLPQSIKSAIKAHPQLDAAMKCIHTLRIHLTHLVDNFYLTLIFFQKKLEGGYKLSLPVFLKFFLELFDALIQFTHSKFTSSNYIFEQADFFSKFFKEVLPEPQPQDKKFQPAECDFLWTAIHLVRQINQKTIGKDIEKLKEDDELSIILDGMVCALGEALSISTRNLINWKDYNKTLEKLPEEDKKELINIKQQAQEFFDKGLQITSYRNRRSHTATLSMSKLNEVIKIAISTGLEIPIIAWISLMKQPQNPVAFYKPKIDNLVNILGAPLLLFKAVENKPKPDKQQRRKQKALEKQKQQQQAQQQQLKEPPKQDAAESKATPNKQQTTEPKALKNEPQPKPQVLPTEDEAVIIIQKSACLVM